MPPKPLDAFRDVADNLDALARSRQALELENPNTASTLRDKFELNLLRRDAAKAWVIATPETAGGLPVYFEGDDIAFEIKSRHDVKAFVSLVDFNATADVSLIFPAPNATDAITPTVRFQIGTRDDDGFSVSLPSGYPFSGSTSTAPHEALETVKLFVTTTEADFRFLEQKGVRAIGKASGPLQTLWETAAGAGSVRDIKRKEMPVDSEDWTTVVRPFVVRRKPQDAKA